MTLLITNISHGWTGDAEGTGLSGAIRIDKGLIREVGALTARPGEEVLDATGCVVTPGLVNTHHDLFQSALKCLSIDRGLDEEALRISARIGLGELALSSATTV